MVAFMFILFVILGCVLASFYTALAMRLSNGESIVKPGSHCNICNHPLKWFDLFPVISFILLNGKCRYCHKKLDIYYLVMELIGGFLFGLSFFLYGLSYELIASLTISSLLIIIFVSDFKYLIILDGVVYVGALIIIISKFIFFGFNAAIFSFLSAFIMFGFMYLIKILGDIAFKRESLGGGDIKLALFIGTTLGIKLSLITVVVASFIALPYALYFVSKKKEKEVPFGPFLILATLLTFIFMEPITEYILTLFIIK